MNSLEPLPNSRWLAKAYSMREGYFWNCIILAAFLMVFLACYSSTLTTDYGFSDDYYDIIPGHQEAVIKKKILEGRPVYGFLYGILYSGGMSIEDLRWIRVISIAGISLLAFGVYLVLVCAQWNRLQSFFVSIVLCTTLPFQVYAAWATCFAFPIAALISLYAFVLADKVRGKQSRWKKMWLTTGAILLQFGAIATYQPAAMFFWVAAAVVLLKNDARKILRHCIRYGIIFSISMTLEFLTYKIISLWSSALTFRGDLASDVIGKWKYFWKITHDIFNFSLLSPYHYLFSTHGIPHPHTYNYHFEDGVMKAIAFAIMTLGLLLYFFRGKTGQEQLLKFAIALFLIPLSVSPLLIISTDIYAYRILLAPASLVVIYMLLAFRGYIDLWPSFPSRFVANTVWAFGAIVSVFLAAHHVHSYIVVPQYEEMEVMRFPLERADLSNVRKIHVIRPISGAGGESLAPLMRFEFGYVSSETDWAAHSMVYHILREINSDHEHIEVGSEYESVNSDTGIDSSLIEAPSDTLVIDMRNLPARLQAYRWIDDGESVLGTLVSQSVFNIYRDDRFLYYTKDTCSQKDYQARFFLHVVPENLEDLPEHRRQYGFDSHDFDFQNYAVTYNGNSFIYDGKCMAVIRTPDYRDARIVTGQFVPGEGRLWESEFSAGRAEP